MPERWAISTSATPSHTSGDASSARAAPSDAPQTASPGRRRRGRGAAHVRSRARTGSPGTRPSTPAVRRRQPDARADRRGREPQSQDPRGEGRAEDESAHVAEGREHEPQDHPTQCGRPSPTEPLVQCEEKEEAETRNWIIPSTCFKPTGNIFIGLRGAQEGRVQRTEKNGECGISCASS
jgi:hypothetical protein